MFIVNFSRGAKYQNSSIVHCHKQLNQFVLDQTARKKAEEAEKELRWREWMDRLDQEDQDQDQDQEVQEEEGGSGQPGMRGRIWVELYHSMFMMLLHYGEFWSLALTG